MKTSKIGLALGGGGARGLAHIGILKVLEKARVPVSVLAGTSMGGLVAAAYAAGFTTTEMEERAVRFGHLKELMKMVDLTPQRRGLLEGQKVRNYIRDWLGDRMTFSDLLIPTVLTGVDLATGNEVFLHTGPLLPAVFATIAMPGIFKPVMEDGRILVDGGVLDNLPVKPAYMMGAEHVIAVDVHIGPQMQMLWDGVTHHPHWPLPMPEFFNDFYLAELIMVANITEHRLEIAQPDILIRPTISPEISMLFGFHRAKEIIHAGALAAEEHLDAIRALIAHE